VFVAFCADKCQIAHNNFNWTEKGAKNDEVCDENVKGKV
jgi:hypothetical protein